MLMFGLHAINANLIFTYPIKSFDIASVKNVVQQFLFTPSDIEV